MKNNKKLPTKNNKKIDVKIADFVRFNQLENYL